MRMKICPVFQARLGLVEDTEGAQYMVATSHSPRSSVRHQTRETTWNSLQGLGEFRVGTISATFVEQTWIKI